MSMSSALHCQTCCSWVPRYHDIGTGVFYHCSCCWREFDNNWSYSTAVAWRGSEYKRDPRCDYDVPFLAFPVADRLTKVKKNKWTRSDYDAKCEHKHKVPKSKSVFVQVLGRSLQAAEKGMECASKKKQMQAHVINVFSSLVSPCFFHDQPLSCLPLRSLVSAQASAQASAQVVDECASECGSPCKKPKLE